LELGSAPGVGAPDPLLGLEQGGLGALSTTALMEPVDASNREARSMHLGRLVYEVFGRIQKIFRSISLP